MKKLSTLIFWGGFSLLLCNPLWAQTNQNADPGSSGISWSKSPVQVGETATLTANLGNFGGDPIPTNSVDWTLNIPANILVSSVTLAGPFVINEQFVDTDGTTVIRLKNSTDIPAPCFSCTSTWDIVVNVKGQAPQGGPFNALLNIVRTSPSVVGNLLSSNDNQTSAITVQGALPVTLTSFTATKEGQVAQLKWSTTAETNSDRFEIERSQNGKNWDLIGTQKSNGESTTLKNYTFSDSKPLNGENLYRLKMIDKDATYAYSRIQSLTFESDLAPSFYPNPVAEKLIIKTEDFSLVKNVKIFDTNGRTVYQSSATPSSEINVQNLSAGLYVVQMVSKSGAVISHKVIKQ